MKLFLCDGPLACDEKVFMVPDDESPMSCPYCDMSFLEKEPELIATWEIKTVKDPETGAELNLEALDDVIEALTDFVEGIADGIKVLFK